MLTLVTKPTERYDDDARQFIVIHESVTYKLEHSLYTIALWESMYKVPFLSREDKSDEEFDYYIQCMSLEGPVDTRLLSTENYEQIIEYIGDIRTATIVSAETTGGGGGTFTSSELLYGIMVVADIPWEAQHWHFSRLETLIRVVGNLKSEKKKKSRSEILQENAKLNEERKKELGTKG